MLCLVRVQQEHFQIRIDPRRDAGSTEETLTEPDDVIALPDFALRCQVSDLYYSGTPLAPRQPRSG